MKSVSPLRYPGGKSRMAGLLAEIRSMNGLGQHALAEPFAGGAGASLLLLFREEAERIRVNDADPAIFSFWWTLINRSAPFIELLRRAKVTMNEWRVQREVVRGRSRVSKLRLAYAAFYLNRCNRSGIIMNGGPIGGVAQTGKWKLDARFPKPELIRRCERVVEYRERINVTGDDGLEFIRASDVSKTFFFIDPPYFNKGATLYLNALDHQYHCELAGTLRSMQEAAWVLTYDDCPEIRQLYDGWATIRPFGLQYTAADRRQGAEVLICPKWLRLPSAQRSLAVKW
ncbi:MAG: DNA adenine methylase [Planctomycetaceae bacterium]|nr:DNA adenine methylase [Planctomycetaceae bacterium]